MNSTISGDKKYIKMTETPIPRLIVSLGIPTTISMLITNIYNMADTYFVSQISIPAGGAASIVFGIMAIIQAFGFMFGHGAGSNISRLLGSRDIDRASRFASTAFFSAIISGLLITALGLIFIEPLMYLMGSTDEILPYAKDYGLWILLAAPAMAASCVLNNILRYEGMATLAMVGLTTGGILNMGLDPIFIFVFDMGIHGAGLATALSQYISFGILLSMFLMKKTQSRLSPKLFVPSKDILGNTIVTGLPSFARQGLNSISSMVVNNVARGFGEEAIAAIGYVFRTSNLVFSVGLGIGQGFQPVSGFNYGAKKYSRVRSGALFTLGIGMVLIGVLAAGCFIFSPEIIGMFIKPDERPEDIAKILEIGIPALRLMCVFLLFFPVSVVGTMLFQSIGESGKALILSLLQSGGFFIPLCLILPKFLKILGIQLAQPIAYLLSALVSLPMLLIFLKKLPKDE